jgi:arginine N-succinyltransferase
MFIIRQAVMEDLPTLLKLAKMVHFINLPADPDIIGGKIAQSRLSFSGKVKSPRERQFMFCLEDIETGNVVGTSSIIACVSWPGRPHTYLEVRKRQLYSNDLQTGQVHMTVQLGIDETGPSEIGGLILGPSYRGHKLRLGTMLSLVRFHFIGAYRKWFPQRIIAEMMGPLTPDSRNLLWEYLGRRFINLSFAEADRFCQHSKEFITALFPREEIYVSLLPPEARNLIGKVGKETEPAKALLEGIGFKYKNQVDPFDGGPYLDAVIDDIPLVRDTKKVTLASGKGSHGGEAFVSLKGEHGYRAIRCSYAIDNEALSIPAEMLEVLGAKEGDAASFTPLPKRRAEAAPSRDGQAAVSDANGRPQSQAQGIAAP